MDTLVVISSIFVSQDIYPQDVYLAIFREVDEEARYIYSGS